MRGGEKAKEKGPPINASSKDEEAFIQYVMAQWIERIWWGQTADACGDREFIKNANAEEQKAKH